MLADVFGLDAVWAIVIIAILLFGGAAIPKLASGDDYGDQWQRGTGLYDAAQRVHAYADLGAILLTEDYRARELSDCAG